MSDAQQQVSCIICVQYRAIHYADNDNKNSDNSNIDDDDNDLNSNDYDSII